MVDDVHVIVAPYACIHWSHEAFVVANLACYGGPLLIVCIHKEKKTENTLAQRVRMNWVLILCVVFACLQ